MRFGGSASCLPSQRQAFACRWQAGANRDYWVGSSAALTVTVCLVSASCLPSQRQAFAWRWQAGARPVRWSVLVTALASAAAAATAEPLFLSATATAAAAFPRHRHFFFPTFAANLRKNMLPGLFEDKPVYRKFLILVFIILLNTIIFSLIGGLLTDALYGINMMENPEVLSNLEDPAVVGAIKLLQIFTTGLGMFIIPAIVASVLFSKRPSNFLSLKLPEKPIILALGILLMFSAVPLINLIHIFNQQMELPSFLSGIETWMKESEANAERITEVFLSIKSTQELFYNLLIVAVLPALGEELLFRGVLQKLFKELTNNVHAAVIITAILFSAIHMQFYGFFPRMLLGLMFGYLLVWTGSIWVPIIAHLINNGAAVIFAYYAQQNNLPFDQDTVGTGAGEWPLTLISIAVVGFLLFTIHRLGNRSEDEFR